jgi:hypothetical protein
MGLTGHQCKLHHKARCEFDENFDWRKYYLDVFGEEPKIEVTYETKSVAKSLDDIHNRIYEMHVKNRENIREILKLTSEHHMYTDMDHLLHAYQKCEEHQEKLENKIRRAQMFGYDVAHILERDKELYYKYKRKHEEEKREKS